MQHEAPCPPEEFLWSIAVARLLLPADVHLQAPPNLSDDFGVLLDAGIDDWGGVSPVTADHVNPERPWPALDRLRDVTEARGFALAPRLTVYPRYVLEPERWLDPARAVRGARPQRRRGSRPRRSRIGVAREDLGGRHGERRRRDRAGRAPLHGVVLGRRQPSPGAGAGGPARPRARCARCSTAWSPARSPASTSSPRCFGPAAGRSAAVAEVADELRRQTVGDAVTWVHNRNINYTNVCTFKCRFCGFSKGPLSLNLRGTPYLLTLDDIAGRTREAAERGATEVCLQGGIHPDFDGDYYIDVTRAVKEAVPDIHVHGFTALEVTEGAKRLGEPLADYLRRLMDAGLRSPARAPPPRSSTTRCGRSCAPTRSRPTSGSTPTARPTGSACGPTSRSCSARSSSPGRWARHLVRTRDLQKETGGFTEFVRPALRAHGLAHLPPAQGPAGPDVPGGLLVHAVARIAYHGWIPNIQASWVKIGLDGVAPAAAGRLQRPRRHADEREHLPGRRRQPRPGDDRGRLPGAGRAARPHAPAATTLYGPAPRASASAGPRASLKGWLSARSGTAQAPPTSTAASTSCSTPRAPPTTATCSSRSSSPPCAWPATTPTAST